MFRGHFEHAIDAKGRTSLPSRFRDVLAAASDARLVLTPSPFDPCLHLFPMKAWEEFEAKIAALPPVAVPEPVEPPVVVPVDPPRSRCSAEQPFLSTAPPRVPGQRSRSFKTPS